MICWMHPTNMTIMLIGQFIKNIGGLPCSYVFMALFADVLDHMEWKTGFRSDHSSNTGDFTDLFKCRKGY